MIKNKLSIKLLIPFFPDNFCILVTKYAIITAEILKPKMANITFLMIDTLEFNIES